MPKRSITDDEGESLVHLAIVQLQVDAVRKHLSSIRFRILTGELLTFDELLRQAWIVSVSKKAKRMLDFDVSRDAYRQVLAKHDRELDSKRAKLKEMIGVLFQHGYRASSYLYMDFLRMAEYELAEALLRFPMNETMDAADFQHMLISTDQQFRHDPTAQHLLEVLVDKVIVPNWHRDRGMIRSVLSNSETTDFCYDLLERKLWSQEEMRARKGPMKFLSTVHDTAHTTRRNKHIVDFLGNPHNANDIIAYIGGDAALQKNAKGNMKKTRTKSRNRSITRRCR